MTLEAFCLEHKNCYIRQSLIEVYGDHRECQNGSTFSAMFENISDEEGWIRLNE